MNELSIVYLFLGLLAAFVIIGALIPKYLPSLVRYLDTTVLKEEKDANGDKHPSKQVREQANKRTREHRT